MSLMAWLKRGASLATFGTLGLSVELAYEKYRALTRTPGGPGLTIAPGDEGAEVPLIFGRVKVTNPIPAFMKAGSFVGGTPLGIPVTGGEDSVTRYGVQALLVLGIPFIGGNNHVHAMWVGGAKLKTVIGYNLAGTLEQQNGAHNPAQYASDGFISRITGLSLLDRPSGTNVGGDLEYFNGSPTQMLVDAVAPHAFCSFMGFIITSAPHPTASPGTTDGFGTLDPSLMPGYRGYAMVGLYGVNDRLFVLGADITSVPELAFEHSSYPDPSVFLFGQIADEANPAEVLRLLITQYFGGAGLPNVVDAASFYEAARVLFIESNGCSGEFRAASLGEHIAALLHQVNGVMYQGNETGSWYLKLIRPDYDPNLIRQITVDNCERVDNFMTTNLDGVAADVRVTYNDRAKGYQPASKSSAGSRSRFIGRVAETVSEMPYVCTATLALELAARESAELSRPIITCRVTVDRSFYSLNIGDPVAMTWPEYHVSGTIFRVASPPSHGTLPDGSIVLDLVQETFYVHRSAFSGPLYGGGLAGTAGVSGGL